MSSFGAMTLTNAGKNIAAKFVAGEAPLTFAKFALGSGAAADGTDLKTLTNLVEWRQDVGIATVMHSEDDEKITIRGNYTNAAVYEAYSARELGLYALDPDTGNSVLFGYFVDSLPDTVPTESIRAITDTIAVTLVLSGSEEVTAAFDNGELATIQDVEDRRLRITEVYPVGAIYMSTVATNPGELFDGTTWTTLPAGRVLLGAGTADSETVYTAGEMGGEEKHKLTTAEMPAHTHGMEQAGNHRHWASGEFPRNFQFDACNGNDNQMAIGVGDGCWEGHRYDGHTSTDGNHTHTIASTGNGVAHNNLPPYLVVYMWQRTA